MQCEDVFYIRLSIKRSARVWGPGGEAGKATAQQSDIEGPNEITWPRAQTKMTAGMQRAD